MLLPKDDAETLQSLAQDLSQPLFSNLSAISINLGELGGSYNHTFAPLWQLLGTSLRRLTIVARGVDDRAQEIHRLALQAPSISFASFDTHGFSPSYISLGQLRVLKIRGGLTRMEWKMLAELSLLEDLSILPTGLPARTDRSEERLEGEHTSPDLVSPSLRHLAFPSGPERIRKREMVPLEATLLYTALSSPPCEC